jgi:purine-cytosine permease-like protein
LNVLYENSHKCRSPNTYSAALSIQALHTSFARVPRAVWTFVVFVIYVIAGVAGREHFSEILSNFLSILGYWIAFFVAILLEEHFIFRRPGGTLGGYDLTAYNDASRLPVGIAGIFAMCAGVAGAVVGMAEVWYTGPIAKHIGPFGGDLVRLFILRSGCPLLTTAPQGFELAFLFAAIAYAPVRSWEIKRFGR